MVNEINSVIEQIKKERDFFVKAKLLDFLRTKKGVPVKKLAQKLGLKSSYVCHILRLNRLSDIVIDGYYSSLISISHLFVLSRVKDREKLLAIYEQVLAKTLTVSQTEELVREALYGVRTEGDYITEKEKKKLIDELRDGREQVKIKVVQTRVRSRIIIDIKGSAKETSQILRELQKKISFR